MYNILKYSAMILILSCSANAELSRNNQGVVTDTITKLQWQDNINPNDKEKELHIWEATVFCEDLVLDGHSDWRVPNINELDSLVDDTRYNPAWSNIFQMHTNNENSNLTYWSSTTPGRVHGRAWVIQFFSGEAAYEQRYTIKATEKHYVRCVRTLL